MASKLLSTLLGQKHTSSESNAATVQAPPLVSYTVPFIGSAVPFLLNRAEFMEKCRDDYGPVYKLVVGGLRIVVTSSPQAIQSLYASPKSLVSLNIESLLAMTGLKMTEDRFKTVYRSFVSILMRHFTRPNLVTVAAPFNHQLHKQLTALTQDGPATLSLAPVLFTIIHHCMTQALWGPDYPHTKEADDDNFIFENAMEDVVTHVPLPIPFLHRSADQAHARVINRLTHFLLSVDPTNSPTEVMSEALAWSKKHNLTPEEYSVLFAIINWGIYSNFSREAFWVLAYLLLEDSYVDLQTQIRRTVSENYGGLDKILAAAPSDLNDNDFELLDSAIQESLRLTALSASNRRAEADLTISTERGDFSVKKDEWVMIDTRSMHHDASIYKDTNTFQIDRFVKKEGVEVPPVPLPFAAGPDRCRGRDFALHELRIIVIAFLELFDATVDESTRRLPKYNKRNCIAVYRPAEDFRVKLVPRSSS